MNDIKIIKLLPEHAEQVAMLHIQGIPTGFISSLGPGFVTALYQAIATSKSAFGFIAMRDNKVVAFVAFAINVNDLYKSVIVSSGFRLAFSVIRKFMSLTTFKKALETLFYPSVTKKMNLPSSELLSIAISSNERSRGLATKLMNKGLEECRKRKIEKTKVLVSSGNDPANKLYLKFGFELITQIDNHGVLSNIYVVETDLQSATKTKTAGGSVVLTQPRPSVFVTYGWCRSSYTAIRSLARQGIEVHVGDSSPLAMSRFSRYARSFTNLPNFFVEPEKYVNEVCKALNKTGAKVLMPCHEDIGIFAQHRDRLPEDVRFVIPGMDDYKLSEDKFAFLQLAKEAGCPVPQTFEISSLANVDDAAEAFDGPVIVKARTGNSAKGVRLVRKKEQLHETFTDLIDTYNLPQDRWPIVQEFLPGEAAGVCLLYINGKCVASFAEKYLRCKEPGRFGTSTMRVSFDNQQLISHAVAVMDKLQWHGVAHLDFIADKDGTFKLIEINPRLWGALSLAVYAGVDFPYLWYLAATDGEIPVLNNTQNGQIKCRWVIGDCLAFFEHTKRAEFLEALKILTPQKNCYHDDFSLTDPLPFVFEILDYLAKFVKAGFSTNPVTENMIR